MAKWDRDRLIEVLRERAALDIHTFTPGLRRAVQLYFGGAREARLAAGVPDPVALRMAQRRERDQSRTSSRRRDERGLDPAHMGWSRQVVIEMLQERVARGLHVPTALYRAARVYVGGIWCARVIAGVPDPIDVRAEQRRRATNAFEKRHRRPRHRRQ